MTCVIEFKDILPWAITFNLVKIHIVTWICLKIDRTTLCFLQYYMQLWYPSPITGRNVCLLISIRDINLVVNYQILHLCSIEKCNRHTQ